MKNVVLIAGIASLFTAGALAAAPVKAKAPVSNNAIYAGVTGGVALSSDKSVDTGYNAGLQVGYRLDHIRLEEAYNFYNFTATTALKNLTHVEDIRFGTLMTNAYYDFSTGTNFVPYLGAGIGWLHAWDNTADANVQVTQANHFAYQGIVGVDYKLNRNMKVGVNYRYLTWTNAGDKGYTNVISAAFNYYFS